MNYKDNETGIWEGKSLPFKIDENTICGII